MNAWNFVNFVWIKMLVWVHEILFVFLILFFFYFFYLFFLRMYLWIHGTLWILWMKMHLWMYETLWIFWMKMCAWMHEFFFFLDDNAYIKARNSIFRFYFLNDNAWNSIFLYVQIFKWFYKWFFSVNFSKTMFQKDMYEFSKREDMYKRYFQWFSNVWKFMYKGIFFNDFFQCLFKSLYKDFSKYIYFMYIQKGFFQWFFLFKCIYTKNLKYLKNRYNFFSLFQNFTM